MRIKSVNLENIRSYTNQLIEFPHGSVLLSGDIGSGKSTVLAAVEFALFGIKRGELSGPALLRHGKKQGSVELKFEVDGRDIIIKRSLKRGKDDVKQDSGYIISGGLKTEATAVELKARVLDLLGFPPDLVSKSKDLVYRYTVYTPQEQMKQILTSDKESRLDTLRRVFGIDKYKRIRENTLLISRHLREKTRLYEGKIEDLDEKQDAKKQRKSEIKDIDSKIKELMPGINELKEKLELKKKEIKEIEANIQEFNKLKNELSVNETNLKNNQAQLQRNKGQILLIEKDILKTREEIKDKESVDTELLKKDILKRQESADDIEKQINRINKEINILEAGKKASEELKQKIMKIAQCPTCLQEVSDDHKMLISTTEDENIIHIEARAKGHLSKKTELEKELNLIKEGLDKIRKKEAELSVTRVKLLHIGEKTKTSGRLKQENGLIERQLSEAQGKIKEFSEKINALKGSEAKYNLIKKELDELNSRERGIEIKKAELTREKETISKLLLSLEEEIKKKLEAKEKLKDLREKGNWLNKHFVNLVAAIERHVMLAIHQQFNELFKEWFNLLIEDEALNTRLDDSFTPIVEQDGYDVEFNNLSGGEKTSLALAYRLSLNKVINDLITTIKMSDLLILDEPTDGFSTEQLDRVRSVLDQLNLKQVIMVSHESKIEGFVDNIIRIGKEEQVSKVLQ